MEAEYICSNPTFTVPFPSDEPRRRRPPAHDRVLEGHSDWTLVLRLTALRPLHVGEGYADDTPEVHYPAMTMRGRIALPGTSIKGALRCVFEAITHSCLVTDRATLWRSCSSREKLCPACRLYGALAYRGRLSVSDAVASLTCAEAPIITVPPPFSPGRKPALYLDASNKPYGRKFYRHCRSVAGGAHPVQVAPEGTEFVCRMTVLNASPEELALLLTSMGCGSQPFPVKVGAHKAHGLGSVRFEVTGLWECSSARSLDPMAFVRENALPMTDVWEDGLHKVIAGYTWPSEFDAPDGVYPANPEQANA